MLIVDDLLIGLPVKGIKWILSQIQEVVSKELLDDQPIVQALLENELALEDGRIDSVAYAKNHEELMAALRDVRERRRLAAEAAAGEAQPAREAPISGKARLEVDLDFGGYGGAPRDR